MTELFDQVGTAFGDIVASPAVQIGLQLAAVYLVLLWLAAAWWIQRDLHRRVANPLAPYLAAAGVIFATPLFFPLLVIVYRTIRPAETVAEAEERRLTEEALEATVGAGRDCPGCGAALSEDWRLCPWCRQELLRPCPRCAHLVQTGWTVCPWCVAELPARVPRAAAEGWAAGWRHRAATALSPRSTPAATRPQARPAHADGSPGQARA